jgi:hypothetical protein
MGGFEMNKDPGVGVKKMKELTPLGIHDGTSYESYKSNNYKLLLVIMIILQKPQQNASFLP